MNNRPLPCSITDHRQTLTRSLIGRSCALAALLAVTGITVAQAATYQGVLNNFDGDGDTLVDDLPIFRFSFDTTAGSTILFDSLVREVGGLDWNHDGLYTGFDMYFQLYDSANNFITSVDDYSFSGPLNANGSTHSYDSALQYTFSATGSYYLAFGQLSFSDLEASAGYQANRVFSDYENADGQQNFAPWQLDVTVVNGDLTNGLITGGMEISAVPEPGSMLALGLLISGGTLLRSRRRIEVC